MHNVLCAALGDFDGVHLGHAAVIKAAVQNAAGLVPAIYTFTDNCKNAPILTDNNTKQELFYSMGVKKVIFDDFDAVKDLSPVSFVRDILLSKYNIRSVVCGNDFRFGKDASGDIELLKEICYNYDMTVITAECRYNNGIKISSTDIRRYIENGDMQSAFSLLGRYFSISGKVLHGKHLGNTHKTPTVNVAFSENSVIPAYGVYITYTTVDGKKYNSITNVGVRPSVETTDRPNIETNIFDFDCNIYNANITVEFLKMLRPEIKFSDTTALFEQIKKDINTAKSFFNGENNE